MDVQTFITIHDEFADVAIAKTQYYLNEATLEVDPETYGIYTDKAIRLLAAHYLTLAPKKTSTPAAIAALGFNASDVKSIEITDDIKVDFNTSVAQGSPVASKTSSGLDATVYGQQLEALKRSLIILFTFT